MVKSLILLVVFAIVALAVSPVFGVVVVINWYDFLVNDWFSAIGITVGAFTLCAALIMMIVSYKELEESKNCGENVLVIMLTGIRNTVGHYMKAVLQPITPHESIIKQMKSVNTKENYDD
ncbi:hypothetical protein ABMX62_19310 [Vibrio vulnificus]|uniref:hypothetical protein n=1 Tax=Vibrio vulnificus TaxID=672 RepID=UPI004058EB53